MYQNIKKIFKWGTIKNKDDIKNKQSLFLCAFFGIAEDVLLWRFNWLSITFILFFHLIFFTSVCKQISLLRIFVFTYLTALGIDAFEMWLKYKHRYSFLKRIADHDGKELKLSYFKFKTLLEQKWSELIFLRDKNPTKAFLLVNIIFSTIFIIGTYIDGSVLLYTHCMFLLLSNKIITPLQKVLNKIKQHAESDAELEGLIPEISDGNIKLLSIEPEQNQEIDERQILDLWQPDDLPLDEASDSSDNSGSLVSNLTIEKMHTIEGIENSDSSEDEYIPLVQQKEELQSTLEVSHSTNSWSSSAYNALWNYTGAIANMVYTRQDNSKRDQVSSADSLDGFEMVDKNELL